MYIGIYVYFDGSVEEGWQKYFKLKGGANKICLPSLGGGGVNKTF